MKTLYFDCFAGASGDMILGALVGVGVDPAQLTEQLARLGVDGYEIDFEQANRSGISATRAHVRTREEHSHRHLGDILNIIYDARLSEAVKDRAARIFSRLAEAEARVHNLPVERIHFHEVGALDAIIDVIGACIGFELLGVERFVSSPLHVGSGMVEMAHGRFPVPPPAVAELLKNAPVYSTDIKGELLTPTGAAIISTLVENYGPLPAMTVTNTGYGAGTREYENFPNVLRLMIGETEAVGRRTDERLLTTDERLLMIETNIDDMSPQVFGYLMERALALGALDCYFTPAQMKKNRPGVLVQILCRPENRDAVCELLFTETTTLGMRSYEVLRRSLAREIVRVETPYGPIDVKVASIDGSKVKAMPEYEQCRAAAESAGVALHMVEAAALEAFNKTVRT
ncbi:MAG TPA: nickel pincer cofactor biosynthesis protein LarC [Pyrinomonadaceae bacterium]|nr:nickel pincer cofactor biosynthesis protein LarC [Pyrinomonadaceae bacterium]